MQKAETKYLFARNGTYYFRRIIPKDRVADFNKYGKRKREWVHSLNTKSITEALPLLAEYAEHYDNVLSITPNTSGEITIPAVRDRAKLCGTVYQHVDRIVTAPVEDIDEFGAMLEEYARTPNPDPIMIATAGGVVEPPAVTMREALEQFQTDSRDMWLNLSHRARQKKWNKYKEAVTDFEKEMGADLDILKLTKKQVYEYRSKLLERVETGRIKVDTVRKKLMWLRVIVRHAYEIDDRKGDDSPFENLRPIKGIGDEVKRPPILNDEAIAIRKHFAEIGAHPELIAICAVLENTGAHASEIVMLAKDDIVLDAEIPHLLIRPNEFRSMLKTDNRIRKVPLVGIALAAMKRFPEGFPTFRLDNGNGGGKLSDDANHLIQQAAPGKTTYGYRHRMADLMKAKKYEYSLRTAILGQSDGKKRIGDHYGTELPLDVKLEILTKCLPPEAY
ncbi:hypothetical protein SAMN05892877_1058 [Rhizobium subbaraonis]|uniref:Core-binding (CB) domain-containing protein n=1 Tax=Rhizobium subbaraonis TaxID=908946 RepID=A0A285UCR6_9HYPH|nr:hypothetical protein SAMN05892877_1058 [Rhizobium subbaraonis]